MPLEYATTICLKGSRIDFILKPEEIAAEE